MSRKVSVDSVADASADDLLRAVYDLAFRQPTVLGWALAGFLAAAPAWLATVCFLDGNTLGGVTFAVMACFIFGLRYYMLRRTAPTQFEKSGIPVNDPPLTAKTDG